MSKTPKFDAALDQVFSTLVPHSRTCRQCNTSFNIEKEDIEFLKKLRVPPPTLCPRCRLQQLMAFGIGKPAFHKKSCAVPGHTEKVLTFVSTDNQAIVYDDEYYRGDAWDAKEFAVNYDASGSFFDQFNEFTKRVPRQTLYADPKNTNSPYAVGGIELAHSYYVNGSIYGENLQYGSTSLYSKDTVNFLDIEHCEKCYEVTRVKRSFDCKFCIDCSDCMSSSFLIDCKNCSDCFGGANLRNKRYIFWGEQLSRDDYFAKIAEFNLGNYTTLQECKNNFRNLRHRAIFKNLTNIKSINSTGNELGNCNNCIECFQVFEGGENLRHVVSVQKITDSMDYYGGVTSSLIYMSCGTADASRVPFSILVRTGQDSEFCIECNNITNCFGCVALKNKSFCVFNKQYTENEYWDIIDTIKLDMLTRGEYGEFFSPSTSQIAYNESAAYAEFPLSKSEVTGRGWHWADPDILPDIDPSALIRADDLPDNIKGVSDDILHKAVLCMESGRPFRLTPYELNFYRQHNLPLPRLHPDVRIDKLLENRIPYHLYDDTCKKCGEAIKSGYDPAKGYNVYCESCYQKEVV